MAVLSDKPSVIMSVRTLSEFTDAHTRRFVAIPVPGPSSRPFDSRLTFLRLEGAGTLGHASIIKASGTGPRTKKKKEAQWMFEGCLQFGKHFARYNFT